MTLLMHCTDISFILYSYMQAKTNEENVHEKTLDMPNNHDDDTNIVDVPININVTADISSKVNVDKENKTVSVKTSSKIC